MKWTRAHWVGVLAAFALLGDSTLYVVLPASHLFTAIQVGVLLSVNRFARILFNDPTARLIDGRGLAGPMALAMALTLATSMGYGYVGFVGFVALRVLWGLAWSLLRNGASAAILAEDAARHGELQGSFRSLSRFGSLFAVLVGSWLVGRAGFANAFLVLGAASIPALLVVGLLGFERTNRQERQERQEASWRPWRSWRFASSGVVSVGIAAFLVNAAATSLLLVTLSYGLGSFAYDRDWNSLHPNGWIGFASVTMSDVDVLGMTMKIATVAGVAASGRWISEIVLAPVAGHGVDRFGRAPFIAIGGLLAAGALGGCALARSADAYVACAAMTFAMLVVMQTALDALATDRAGSTLSLGRYFTAVDVGTAIGPLCAPVLVESIGLRHTYFGSAAVVAAVALAYMRGGSEHRADHAGLHADG